MQVNLQKDIIELDGTLIKTKMPEELIYIMLNKPRGYLCTAKDEQGRKIARSLITDVKERIYNVGRLDKNSEGLLLFTNDGEFANNIIHPKNKITKEYKMNNPEDEEDKQIRDKNYNHLMNNLQIKIRDQ